MLKILLVFGGEGSEHDVSLMGAKNVIAALAKTSLEVIPAYIEKSGAWLIGAKDLLNIDQLRQNALGTKNLSGSSETFVFNAKSLTKIDQTELTKNDELKNIDVIFPLIHGCGGEDGAIAALGQLLHIPVVGCDVRASQLAWDKDLCKTILRENNIPIVPWINLRRDEELPNYADISQKLASEILFVKPAREGSSVGVSRVKNASDFTNAVEKAFEFDDKILVEKAVIGRELECAILGNSPEVSASDVGEIKLPENDFYSYDEKYSTASQTGLDIPAKDLTDEIRTKIQSFAKKAFVAIGGRGLSRIDFFYDEKSDEVLLNEINTMPGFTNISMYPKLWENSGISYAKLLEKLVELAHEN